jgi:hypothetical protein
MTKPQDATAPQHDPTADPRAHVYSCPGHEDANGRAVACSLKIVMTDTGEEGFGGHFHGSVRLKRVRRATAAEILADAVEG